MAYIGSGPTRFNTADDLTVTDDAEIGGDLTVTGSADINGGTIDGVTIGGASAGAGTFTGLTVGDGHTIGDDGFDNLKIESSSGEAIVLTNNHPTVPLEVNADGGFLVRTLSGSERMRIDSAGRVGIGATVIDANLQVGSLGGSGTYRGGMIVKTKSVGSINTGESAIYIEEQSGSEGYYLGVDSDGGMFFSNSGGDPMMYLSDSNNVGIGTSSPASTLSVSTGDGDIADFNTTNALGGWISISRSGNAKGFIGSSAQLISGGSNDDFTVRATNNLTFGIGATERMRITSGGYLKASNDGVYENATGSFHEIRQTANVTNLYTSIKNASYSTHAYETIATRAGSSAYNFMQHNSGSGGDREFAFRGDGQAYADGSWNGGGADYAEYFEWADGNTSNEDRRGYTVVLDGNKVRKATDDDDPSQIIGAVSATPCVIGDHADNKWSGKFLKDDFGNYIREEHNVVEWTEKVLVEEAQDAILDEEGNVIQESKEAVYTEQTHSYEDWNIPEGITVPDDATVLTHDDKGNRFDHRKLNPDFDPDAEYITRENRPEWSPIGMMGKLRIRTGQPVGDRWIKMRDISETVEEWLVR